MSVIATALKHLIAAGISGDDLVRAVAEMEAELSMGVDRVAEKRRAWDRERKRAKKADLSTGIPPDSTETVENAETPPSLDKEIPPRPPKEIKPIPRVGIALARKAAGFGPPEGVEIQPWNEFCSQRKKPLTSIAYGLIIEKLTEAADVGWPPGELINRAIGSGWETVFVPRELPNVRRADGQSDISAPWKLRDGSDDPLLAAIREARADCAAESAGRYPKDDPRTGLPLQAISR